MKKAFKVILKILMIVIFIISTIFNILTFNSAYGTLLIKHSDEKMLSMVNTEALNLYSPYFHDQKNTGIKIYKEAREDKTIIKSTYKFSFDKDQKLTASILESTQGEDYFIKINSYYKDGIIYKDNNNTKTKKAVQETSITNEILTELYLLQDALATHIESSNQKSSIHISFSPFYVLGISYKIKDENKSATYNYDLSGDLRSISIKYKSGKKELYELTRSDKKIKAPNLGEYK
jgi:hypothetical protein